MVGSRWIEVKSQSKTCASRKIPRNLPMKAPRLHPPTVHGPTAADTTTVRAGNTRQPKLNPPCALLYDGHIRKRINANRCHLNSQHDHVKPVGCQTHGMGVHCLQVH